MKKTLVVGDIQGCFVEFLELLELAQITEKDQIVAVGDLVDRGPDSPGVIKFFQRNPQASTVMGNHERKHIRWFHGKASPAVSQEIARAQFGEAAYKEAIEYMKSLPAFIELDEAIVVHGFWEPRVPLKDQKEEVLTGVSRGERYIQSLSPKPWWELYDGPKPLIAGHHDYSKKGIPLNYENRVYCIDTGCCYGHKLTGLLLPEFKFVSVSAKRNYWGQIRQRYNWGIK
jgi:serine/threonine protein phosphatase 1